jgi:WD40 repeat protein
VTVTPDGKRVVSASWDNTLKVWDLASGAEARTLAGHADGIGCVEITPDGKWVVSASEDHTLKMWDLESGAEERTLIGYHSYVRSVAITPDGKRAVSASGRTLRIWDLESGEAIASFSGEGASIECAVAVTGGPAPNLLIVAGESWSRVHFLRLEGV